METRLEWTVAVVFLHLEQQHPLLTSLTLLSRMLQTMLFDLGTSSQVMLFPPPPPPPEMLLALLLGAAAASSLSELAAAAAPSRKYSRVV
jgi:hypothetical protein